MNSMRLRFFLLLYCFYIFSYIPHGNWSKYSVELHFSHLKDGVSLTALKQELERIEDSFVSCISLTVLRSAQVQPH